MSTRDSIPQKLRPWIEARKRYHLSHAQVQMVRELGMNPKKLGSLANREEEPWKMPLPQYIEHCYKKRFHRARPDDVRALEEKEKEKRAHEHAKQQAVLERDELSPRTENSTFSDPESEERITRR